MVSYHIMRGPEYRKNTTETGGLPRLTGKPSRAKTSPYFSSNTYIIEGEYPDVAKRLNDLEWKQVHQNTKNVTLLWTKVARLSTDLPSETLVNHLSNINELSVKSRLCENLKKSCKYRHFFPECFVIRHGHIPDDAKREFRFCQAEARLRLNDFSDFRFCADYMRTKFNCALPKSTKNSLETIKKADPQYGIRGRDNLWIIKPADLSRGRHIRIIKSLRNLNLEKGVFVLQKYIERPLLIRGRKFDIRQWVLVISKPFSIYLYNECYLRFSAKDYSTKDFDPNIHLTNNSVVKHSAVYCREESMWHVARLVKFLKEERNVSYYTHILPKIKQVTRTVVKAAANRISQRKNSFELLGLDLMLDEDLNVWLIEVNTSPAMDYSTVRNRQPVTEKRVKKVLPDTIDQVLKKDSRGFTLI